MVLLSTVLRFLQESRSNKAADRLKAMVSNTSTVLRPAPGRSGLVYVAASSRGLLRLTEKRLERLPGVENALGVFDVAAPADGSVHAAVRPEQPQLRADDSGNAEVVAREFRGHDVFYRVPGVGEPCGRLWFLGHDRSTPSSCVGTATSSSCAFARIGTLTGTLVDSLPSMMQGGQHGHLRGLP